MEQELRLRTGQGAPPDPHNDAEGASAQYGGYGAHPPYGGGPEHYGSGYPPGYGDPNAGYAPHQGYGPAPGMGYGGGYAQPQTPPGPMPAAFGMENNVANHMALNFGMQYGSNLLKKSQANFSKYLFSFQGLHYYFTVNNSYVKNKLKLLMFPLRHKFRRREVEGHRFEQPPAVAQSAYNYLAAVDDINAPDMYIPLMAFVTYVLLVGFYTGIDSQASFSPEVLIATSSSCMVLTIVEMLALRTGFYVLAAPKSLYSLDLLCYVSYKFFSASLILILRGFMQKWVYLAIWLTLSLFHGFFLLQTLRLYWQGSSSQTATYFLYVVAAFQIPIYFWLQHL